MQIITHNHPNKQEPAEPNERVPPAVEQRPLQQGIEVLEKLKSMEAELVEAANNEFLAICEDIEFGAEMRDRAELDNVGVEDRSVENRRWIT